MNMDQPKTSTSAAYGTKTIFEKNIPIQFPDFAVTFTGTTPANAGNSEIKIPLGDFYKFDVTNGTDSQVVSWSSGTGLIGPRPFTVGGKSYWLELRMSEKLGWLKDNELVISPKSI